MVGYIRAAVAVHAARTGSPSEAVQVRLKTSVIGERLGHVISPRDRGGSPVDPPSDVRDEPSRPRGLVRRSPSPLPLRDGSLSLSF